MSLQLTRHSKLFQFQRRLWRYLSIRVGQVLKNNNDMTVTSIVQLTIKLQQ